MSSALAYGIFLALYVPGSIISIAGLTVKKLHVLTALYP
jgi:hypothetical protein